MVVLHHSIKHRETRWTEL